MARRAWRCCPTATEADQGHRDVVAAHAALAGRRGLNFVGNVEGFAIGTGEADVIVADGFTGNVALKVMEGASAALLGAVRAAALSSTARSKLGGLLLRPALRGLRDELDPEEQGGAVLLGLRHLGVVPARLVRRARVRARDRGRRARRPRGRRRAHARAAGRRGGAAARDGASEAAASVPDQP